MASPNGAANASVVDAITGVSSVPSSARAAHDLSKARRGPFLAPSPKRRGAGLAAPPPNLRGLRNTRLPPSPRRGAPARCGGGGTGARGPRPPTYGVGQPPGFPLPAVRPPAVRCGGAATGAGAGRRVLGDREHVAGLRRRGDRVPGLAAVGRADLTAARTDVEAGGV